MIFDLSSYCRTLAARLFTFRLTICTLLFALFAQPCFCQTTVISECPGGCFCATGEYNEQLMENLINDRRMIEAWKRLRSDPAVKISNTLFCRNSSYNTVPKELTAISDALFLDGIGLTSTKTSALMSSMDNVTDTVTSPVMALVLSDNEISYIGDGAFDSLPLLRLLVLRNNLLQGSRWTTATVSSTFQQLRELDLSLNKFQNIRSNDFGSLPLLERIDLSGNEIATIDQDVLENFPKLRHLDLSDNFITTAGIKTGKSLIPSLEFLSLSNNPLGEFGTLKAKNFLNKFSHLQELNLSGNRLNSGNVPVEAFAGLLSLRTLNLSECDIRNFKQGWLNGGLEKSLQILDLSFNIIPMVSPHHLSIVRTANQSSTPGSFSHITRIPEEKLDSKWLQKLEKLTVLYLNGNYRLTHIEDDAFAFMPNLRFLFLQNCAIRRLNLAAVEHRFGPQPLSNTLPSLTNIWIYGNPISCDCYIRFLKQWQITATTIQHNETRFIDAPIYTVGHETKTVSVSQAMCIAPPSLAGVTVEAAPGQSMTCQEEPYSILIAMLIGPLTFAGSVALTILCGSLHVGITRMRRGTVLSYHAREEMMRNPKARYPRKQPQQQLFSGIGWNRPHSRDDMSGFTPGARGGRYTNLVLGQFGEHHHHEQQNREPRINLTSGVVQRHPSPSMLRADDHRSHGRASVGYCSDTEAITTTQPQRLVTPVLVVNDVSCDQLSDTEKRHSASDTDSVLGRESVRTRSPGSDFPYIDEHDYGVFHSNYDRKRTPRSSSSTTDSGSASNVDRDNHSLNDSRSDGELRQRKETSFLPSNGSHESSRTIPGIAGTRNSAITEETFL